MKKVPFTAALLVLSALFAVPAFAEMLANSVKVENPYVVTVPPTAKMTSAFLNLSNIGKETLSITKVVSSVSKSAEMHNQLHEGGMMKMVHVPTLEIQPNQTLSFEPGSYHIMLIGLQHPLEEGKNIQLTFSFNDGSTLTVNTPVKDIRKMHQHGSMNHEEMKHGEMNHEEMTHDHHGH